MAASLSNHFLSFSPPPLLPPPSKTLTLKSLAFPFRRLAGAKPLSSHLSPRPPAAPPRVAGTDPKIVNGDEQTQALESEADQKELPTMKELILAYKKAVADGDEKVMTEIEAAICLMENEKDNLSLTITELTAEITSSREKVLRTKADLENYRKRTEKDRVSFTSNVQGEVIESLLPIVDSFERAKQQLKPETEKERIIDTSYQGIYKQFVEIMRSLRVSVVGTVGKPFDPSVHEAVAREDSHQFKEGIVTHELRRGFVLGDRLLRPASVKVSIGPGPGKAPSSTDTATVQPGAAAERLQDATPAPSSS